MPLSNISPNLQEAHSPSRKRTLDEFGQMENIKPLGLGGKLPDLRDTNNKENGWISTPKTLAPSAAESSPASLTPSGSSPPDRRSESPNPTPTRNPNLTSPAAPQVHLLHEPVIMAPSPLSRSTQSTLDAFAHSGKRKREDGEIDVSLPSKPALSLTSANAASSQPPSSAPIGQQPARKKRATKEEMEARKAEVEAKKQEKEKKEAEKAAKAAENATEKAKAEAVKQAKAEERERKKREKEEEEIKKAEEKAKKAEEQAKKARAQPTLANFFKMKPSGPKASNAEDAAHASPTSTPKKADVKGVSVYDQLFKPFFVKDQVTLAPIFQMDEETREAKTSILEEYLDGKRDTPVVKPFDPEQALQLPFLLPRGRLYPCVREIMAEWTDNSSRTPIDLTTESQNTQIRKTRQALHDVPMKFLGFKEDVRPPYYGTVTHYPSSLGSLRKLARNPVARDILPLQYNYDSEAEWQEEDGEDVDLMDDEEDDGDNDEEMDDFLDDSEDVSLARPQHLVSGLEPKSTGICWENRKRLGPSPKMYKYRMEFILDTLDHHSGIDPFSTQYWEPAKPAPAASAPPTSTATKSENKAMAPPPGPTDAFKALGAPTPAKKMSALQADMIQKLKDMVLAKRGLSKVGIVELFNLENKVSKAAIKNTLEMIAEKSGKEWVLKTGA